MNAVVRLPADLYSDLNNRFSLLKGFCAAIISETLARRCKNAEQRLPDFFGRIEVCANRSNRFSCWANALSPFKHIYTCVPQRLRWFSADSYY
jgi:hypothetical protein